MDEQTVRYKDQSLSAQQLAKLLRPPPDDTRPARLHIRPGANVPDETAAIFADKVTKCGFEGVIETKDHPKPSPAQPGKPIAKPD